MGERQLERRIRARAGSMNRRAALKLGGALAAAGFGGCMEPGDEEAGGASQAAAGAVNGLGPALAPHVDRGYVPGVVAAVWHKGRLEIEALGNQAYDGAPMQEDSIFRIASIGKPITATAAMILVEEGRLGLDDPVDELLPELAEPRVLTRIDAPLDHAVPAERPVTLRDLLTLRLGLGAIMIFPPEYPIQVAMNEAGIAPGPLLFTGTPDEYMRRLGELPLAAQPGESWFYHTGMDVAGILIERAAGQSLGELMAERIFEPLGMADTAFHVPQEKQDRLVTAYWSDFETGEFGVFEELDRRYREPPAFEAGGGGQVSTVPDYVTFCRMLLGKGELDGVRILSAESVEEMTRDQLTGQQKTGPHTDMFFHGHSSWGLGMAVALRQAEPWLTPGRFGWDGGYGTSAYTDPRQGLIGVLMTQRLMDSPEPPPTFTDFWRAAYEETS